MFNFDGLTVSELNALCAELGIVVANSARKSEYVQALENCFQQENVEGYLMSLNRESLKNIARRFSIERRGGSKREMTDAILAKVNPQSSEATSEDEAEQAEETRKGLPLWAWALIVAAAIFIGWLAFRPRPAATDLSSIQTSLSKISTSVGNIDKKVDGLSDRVVALEATPADEPVVEEPADEEPVVEEPVVEESVVVESPDDFDLIEISTGSDPLVGINDKDAVPTATLNPGEGIMLSSDSGSFVRERFSIPSETGYMAYIFNDSDESVELKAYTGFNEDNGRFNVSAVLFEVKNLKGLREKTLLENCSENKPAVFGKIWNGTELVTDPDLGNLNKMCDAQVKVGRSLSEDTWVSPSLVEKGTDLTLPEIGIYDSTQPPAVTLEPGEGLWASSDKGQFYIDKNLPIVSQFGFTSWIYNDSDVAVTVTFETGWNDSQDPDRWNVSIVVFSEADPASLAEYAKQKSIDEVKPNNYSFVWDGQTLVNHTR